jgi:hypothetical protein
MKTKTVVILALGVGVALAGLWIVGRQPARTVSPPKVVAARPPSPVPTPAQTARLLEPSPAEPTATVPAGRDTPEPPKQAAPRPTTAPASESVPVSVARAALSWVGVDRHAEAVWVQAINDPRLSAKTRQDLIEDLNEDGFPDPRHPTTEDLPLIVSRLELIEDLAPYAMDDVNAAAFQEAYKDLANMYGQLTEQ